MANHFIAAAKQLDFQGDILKISAPVQNAFSFYNELVNGSSGIGLNSLVGLNAATPTTTGLRNTAHGTTTLAVLTTGSDNSVYGFNGGKLMTTGARNTIDGSLAGDAVTTATDCTYLGYNAGGANVTAANQTFLGSNAGAVCTAASCSFGGYQCGLAATTGTGNTGFGFQCMDLGIFTGINNSGFGVNCLRSVTTGQQNNAFGQGALALCTTGSGNHAGATGLPVLTTGSNNTAWGGACGNLLLTGSTNSFFGFQAGSAYTGAESNNICINNAGVIGDSAIIRIGTAGTHLKNFQAGIAGITTDAAAVACLVSGTGQLGVTSSQEEMKMDFADLDEEKVKKFIQSIPVRHFKYASVQSGREQIGPNVEDLEDMGDYPEMIVEFENGVKAIAQQNLVWYLVQEQQRIQREMDVMRKQESKYKPDYKLKRKVDDDYNVTSKRVKV